MKGQRSNGDAADQGPVKLAYASKHRYHAKIHKIVVC